jgi:calpain-7
MSKGWLGRYSARDEYGWSDPNFCAEVGYNATSAKERDDDGVFYISWDDVLIYFRNLHLSWNPALFRHKTTMHGCWKKEQGPNDDSFNVGENPQYVVSLSTNAVKRHATLWILLTRHVTKQEQEGGEVSLSTPVSCSVSFISTAIHIMFQVSDYLTLHIHRISSSKQRVWYPGGGKCVLTGAYTNNQHVLIRYDAEGLQDKYLSLVLSQHKKSNDLCYTISVSRLFHDLVKHIVSRC